MIYKLYHSNNYYAMNTNEINFTAVDFETATLKTRMICQAGIVIVRNGVITEKHCYLIQPPENKIDERLINVHGITPEQTEHCPTFIQLWPILENYFKGTVVAHNANFDYNALLSNLDYYRIKSKTNLREFKDTYAIYDEKLDTLCEKFGIPRTNRHDALFDAECCAVFYNAYLKGETPEQCYAAKTITSNGVYHERLKGDVLKKDLTGANPENPFYDKKVVITGLFPIERSVLAKKIKSLGADINTSVNKLTDIVLLGEKAGPQKLVKIKELSDTGIKIRIIKSLELINILKEYDAL